MFLDIEACILASPQVSFFRSFLIRVLARISAAQSTFEAGQKKPSSLLKNQALAGRPSNGSQKTGG
jgi:hypothetical protein